MSNGELINDLSATLDIFIHKSMSLVCKVVFNRLATIWLIDVAVKCKKMYLCCFIT